MDDVERGRRLAEWFGAHARDLPWRLDPKPYHVLLGEFMTQQTRIDTALPYYHRFLGRWPTLDDLAAAPVADVLTAWAGLGYYRRARSLHEVARRAVAQGGLPRDVPGLLSLPGIGPYTAGAIASVAFGERVPGVDGNVERVLSRVVALEGDPAGAARASVWDVARRLVVASPAAPSTHNQGLMELGSLVCRPRAPDCPACPWQSGCAAATSPDPTQWPKKAPARKPVAIRGASAVLWDGAGRWLAGHRSAGLLAGLWEPPRADDATALDALLAAMCGIVPSLRSAGIVAHIFTHRKLTCEVSVGRWEGPVSPAGPYDRVAWVGEPADCAVSALARRLVTVGGPPPG